MNKEIQEVIMYLEHTTIDDFNLENYQAENRIWAIKTLIQELQRKDNIINELKEWARLEKYLQTTKVEERIYDEFLDKIKELEGDNK